MKKIIRVFAVLLFALVAFAGIARAEENTADGLQEENPTVKVNFYDNVKFKDQAVYSFTFSGLGSGKRFDLDQIFTRNNEYYTAFNNSKMQIGLKDGTKKYTFINYVDENGIEINSNYTGEDVVKSFSIETYSTKTNSLRITLKGTKEYTLTKSVTINVYVQFEEYIEPVINHIYTDYVSTGSGSFKGIASSYTHKFSDPSIKTPKTHYQFLYWQFVQNDPADEQVDATKEYKDGDKFTYSLSGKPSGFSQVVRSYAWWQPDVTLNLYSDGTLLSSVSSFESVSIGENPVKFGYTFLGWFDAEGNKIEETTFTAAEAGIDSEVREYTLYAKWERIMVDVKVSVVWDDSNNEDEVRPESVVVELTDGEEVVDSVELSEENNWTHTFNVPKYNTEEEIEYTVSQNEVEFYTTTVDGSIEDGFVITNFHEAWPKGDTDYEEELVQTGSSVNTIYVSFMGLTILGTLISRKKRLS